MPLRRAPAGWGKRRPVTVEQVWAVGIAALSILAGLAGLGQYRIARLERQARLERERTERAQAAEAEARALKAADRARLQERRTNAVLRAVAACTPVAGAAGMFAIRAQRRLTVVVFHRLPDVEPLNQAVVEVSSAFDEIRVVGPRTVAEAMGPYFDAIMEIYGAATSGGPNAVEMVTEKARVLFDAKAALIEAAQMVGIGDQPD